MRRITVKLSELKPNPYKKFIQGGQIDDTVVTQIMESAERTSFWEQWVVRETDHGYQLAFGHNRLEAAKKILGTDAKVSVQIEPYSNEQMYIALADENATGDQPLTSRVDTVMHAQKLLRANPGWCRLEVPSHSETAHSKFARKDNQHEHGSVECIFAWLGEKNWSRATVGRCLQMGEANRELLSVASSKPNMAKPGQIGEMAVLAISSLDDKVQQAAVEAIKDEPVILPLDYIEEAVEEVKHLPAKQQPAGIKRAIKAKAGMQKVRKIQHARRQEAKGKPKTKKPVPDVGAVMEIWIHQLATIMAEIRQLEPHKQNINKLASFATLHEMTKDLFHLVRELAPAEKKAMPMRIAFDDSKQLN